jgi:hypothetical protein
MRVSRIYSKATPKEESHLLSQHTDCVSFVGSLRKAQLAQRWRFWGSSDFFFFLPEDTHFLHSILGVSYVRMHLLEHHKRLSTCSASSLGCFTMERYGSVWT